MSIAKGPFEYAVSLGGGLTDVYSLKESVIECYIPIQANETVKVKVTSIEALEDVTVSLEWA